MSAFADLNRLFARGLNMSAWSRALSRAKMTGRGPIGKNAWTDEEVGLLLELYDDEAKKLPLKQGTGWEFLGEGDRRLDPDGFEVIDVLRRIAWKLVRNANAPATMGYVWIGVSEAWGASNQHVTSPWCHAAVQYAQAALEASREEREESAIELSRWAVWAAWAARYRPDDLYLEYQAWLTVIRDAATLLERHVRFLTEAERYRTKADDTAAHEKLLRSPSIVPEELQRQREKSWSIPEIQKRRDALASTLRQVQKAVRGAEGMIEKRPLEEVLPDIARVAADCLRVTRTAIQKGGCLIADMDAAWPPVVGPAIVRLWTPVPTQQSFGPRLPALTIAQAERLGEATNVAAMLVALRRTRLDGILKQLRESVLPGKDPLTYFDPVQEAREGLSGREVLVGQLLGHLTGLLTSWWACEAAGRALEQAPVPLGVKALAMNRQIIADNNSHVVEEAVRGLRELAAGA